MKIVTKCEQTDAIDRILQAVAAMLLALLLDRLRNNRKLNHPVVAALGKARG